jgi:6-phosphogluconolactonase
VTVPAAPVADVPAAFTATVVAAFGARPGERFALVLSGGSTARACYEHLAAATGPSAGVPLGPTIDWSRVDVFVGDERIVPPGDPDANQRLIREALLDRVGTVGSFTPMPTEGDVAQCVQDYQDVMARLLKGRGIDLIHLGMGGDGHTASLFPGSSALDAPPSQLVAANEDPNGRNPHPRLTLTLPAINAARCAVFTVTGEDKLQALAQLRQGDDLPASRVEAAQVIWLVDGAAFGNDP